MTTILKTQSYTFDVIYQKLCAVGNFLASQIPDDELPPFVSAEEEKKIIDFHKEIDPEFTYYAKHLFVNHEVVCPLKKEVIDNSLGYSESVIDSRNDKRTAKKIEDAFCMHIQDDFVEETSKAFIVELPDDPDED